jgi:hypothetical protein
LLAREAARVGSQDAELRARQLPLGADAGGREGDHQHIEAVEHVEAHADGHGSHLEGAHAAAPAALERSRILAA